MKINIRGFPSTEKSFPVTCDESSTVLDLKTLVKQETNIEPAERSPLALEPRAGPEPRLLYFSLYRGDWVFSTEISPCNAWAAPSSPRLSFSRLDQETVSDVTDIGPVPVGQALAFVAFGVSTAVPWTDQGRSGPYTSRTARSEITLTIEYDG